MTVVPEVLQRKVFQRNSSHRFLSLHRVLHRILLFWTEKLLVGQNPELTW